MKYTVDAWAKYTTDKWRANLNRLGAVNTGALYDSIAYNVIGGDTPTSVRFKFNDYGIFVQHGAGNGIRIGNPGDLGFTPTRREKKWYNPTIWREVWKLGDILAEKYGQECSGVIVSAIQEQIID